MQSSGAVGLRGIDIHPLIQQRANGWLIARLHGVHQPHFGAGHANAGHEQQRHQGARHRPAPHTPRGSRSAIFPLLSAKLSSRTPTFSSSVR